MVLHAQDFTEPAKSGGSSNVLKQLTKKTRHRGGYEDGISTTFKRRSVLAFIQSNDPIDLMGQCTQFAFEGSGSDVGAVPDGDRDIETLLKIVRTCQKTTEEVRNLCSDLQVLGRKDFKVLLKW